MNSFDPEELPIIRRRLRQPSALLPWIVCGTAIVLIVAGVTLFLLHHFSQVQLRREYEQRLLFEKWQRLEEHRAQLYKQWEEYEQLRLKLNFPDAVADASYPRKIEKIDREISDLIRESLDRFDKKPYAFREFPPSDFSRYDSVRDK